MENIRKINPCTTNSFIFTKTTGELKEQNPLGDLISTVSCFFQVKSTIQREGTDLTVKRCTVINELSLQLTDDIHGFKLSLASHTKKELTQKGFVKNGRSLGVNNNNNWILFLLAEIFDLILLSESELARTLQGCFGEWLMLWKRNYFQVNWLCHKWVQILY